MASKRLIGVRRQLDQRRAQFAFFLLLTITAYCIENVFMLLQYVDKEQTPSDYNTKSQQQTAAHHIVVAHCKENLEWLNQLHTFNPSVCNMYHVHIYSKCGADVDLNRILPDIVECTTLHRIRNVGTEEYAHMRYIEDRYDSLPLKVSFVQGGALTENPHIIYDILILSSLPDITYMSLSRHVRHAWHIVDYKQFNKTGEKDILDSFAPYLFDYRNWDADWRGMFSVSAKEIRQHSWNKYYMINDILSHDKCTDKFRNCAMEIFFSSIFGCNQYLFSAPHGHNCTSGVYKNVSNAVFEEDYQADGAINNGTATNWAWSVCGTKTLLRSISQVNGGLICLDAGMITTPLEKSNRDLLNRFIAGDTVKADYSSVKWKQAPQWARHNQISNEQIRDME